MTKPVARLTTRAQMVAALPLTLGYVPTESLVVVCCHEPRGRMGLTMRYDLPPAGHEPLLVDEVVRRVRQQRADRVLVAVYTAEPDGVRRPREAMVDRLRVAVQDLVVTEAVLVRGGRFWSYLCHQPSCCPAAGTPVEQDRESSPVRLLEAERVLLGRAVLPDREALEASLAGPTFLEAAAAEQRCAEAADGLVRTVRADGLEVARARSVASWQAAVERFRLPPARLEPAEAAFLAVSLGDVTVRDGLAAALPEDLPPLLALLTELGRVTPAPDDASVCVLYAWLAYCEGGGAEVTIALQRALRSDPDDRMAQLLLQALHAQVPPEELRAITAGSRRLGRRAG